MLTAAELQRLLAKAERLGVNVDAFRHYIDVWGDQGDYAFYDNVLTDLIGSNRRSKDMKSQKQATVEEVDQLAGIAGVPAAFIRALVQVVGVDVVLSVLKPFVDSLAQDATALGKARKGQVVATMIRRQGNKADMVAMPSEELERRRKLAKIPDTVWTVLLETMNEQQLGDFVNKCLAAAGQQQVADGTKSYNEFWGHYA